MSMIKTIWKDQVGSGLIVAAIIAAGASAWATFKGWWRSIGVGIVDGWNWLALSSTHPNWLLILLWLSALAVLLVLAALVIVRIRASEEPVVTWRSYRRDQFHGAEWQWWYNEYSGAVENLIPLCPACQCQLVCESPDYFNSSIAFVLHCKHCDRNVAEFKEGYEETLRGIRLLIQRKIRTEEWRDVAAEVQASG